MRTCAQWALIAFLPAACAHAPHAIALPSTAALATHLTAAQASNARAVAIDHQEQSLAADAVSHGIAAGSEEAHELSTLASAGSQADTATQDQLSVALYQKGALDAELAQTQKQVDLVVKDDQAKTARVGVLTRSLRHWQLVVLCLFAADFLAGSVIQAALRAAASFVFRAAGAFARHLIAFWPVLLALA